MVDDRQDSPRTSGWRTHLTIIVAFCVIAVALTWPLASQLTTHGTGDGPDADDQYFAWHFQWARESWIDHQHGYWQTRDLFWPHGVDLRRGAEGVFIILLSIPLQLVTANLVLTANLLVLALFVLNAYAGFVFCRTVVRSDVAAFLGGLSFGFSSYFFARSHGHYNLLSAFWIPLWIVWWQRLLATGATRYAVLSGVALALAGLSSWYYLVVASMVGLFMAVWQVASGHRLGPPTLRAMLMALGTTAILLLPFVIPMLQSYHLEPPAAVDPLARQYLSLDLLSIVIPYQWSVLGTFFKHNLGSILTSIEHVGFLGFVGLGLLAFVIVRRRWMSSEAWRAFVFWGLVAAMFWVFALGPELKIAGQATGFPLPARGLYLLPFLSSMNSSSRFIVIPLLFIGFATASAVDLLRRLPRRRYLLIVTVLFVLLLGERITVPYHTEDRRLPPYLEVMRRDTRPVAVLDVPVGIGSYATGIYYQTVHQHPLISGYIQRLAQTPVTMTTIAQSPLLRFLTCRFEPFANEAQPIMTTSQFVEALRRLNVGYVILEEVNLTEACGQRLRPFLDQVLAGQVPDYRDGRVRVYAVDTLAAALDGGDVRQLPVRPPAAP